MSPDLKDLKDYLSTCGFEVLELRSLGIVKKLGESDDFKCIYTYKYVYS